MIENKEEAGFIDDFDYHLPDELIARYPLAERDTSRLLVYNKGQISHAQFRQLPALLPPDALLIFNNTRVVPARLHFQKDSGAWIELLISEEKTEETQKLAHGKVWECMVGNKKKWPEGEELKISKTLENGESYSLHAQWHNRDANLVRLEWMPANLGFYEVLSEMGEMPIPPYLNREAEESDKTQYQTVYASQEGAIAAPTAGLHFTPRVLEDIAGRNIASAELTLHVGLGTFKPMKAERIADHEMHPEKVIFPASLFKKIADHKGPIVAVGTTSVRSLESAYWLATQWMETGQLPSNLETEQPYKWHNRQIPARDAFRQLSEHLEKEGKANLKFSTQLYIMPGYRFRVVDGLVTNFHQPKSTLTVLIAALIGPGWKPMYGEAIAERYRFLSYGDSSLLLP